MTTDEMEKNQYLVTEEAELLFGKLLFKTEYDKEGKSLTSAVLIGNGKECFVVTAINAEDKEAFKDEFLALIAKFKIKANNE